jgi:hypothetical protein
MKKSFINDKKNTLNQIMKKIYIPKTPRKLP